MYIYGDTWLCGQLHVCSIHLVGVLKTVRPNTRQTLYNSVHFTYSCLPTSFHSYEHAHSFDCRIGVQSLGLGSNDMFTVKHTLSPTFEIILVYFYDMNYL